MLIRLISMSLLLCACGTNTEVIRVPHRQNEEANLDKVMIEQRLAEIEQTQTLIQNTVKSDFADCSSEGSSSADPLLNRICKVAQASTAEARVQLKGEITSFVQTLEKELGSIKDDLQNIADSQQSNQDRLNAVDHRLDALAGNLAELTSRVESSEKAIEALQDATASIKNDMTGYLVSVEVGDENLGAGPVYETLLRSWDRKRLLAYRESRSQTLPLVTSKPLAVTKDSPLLRIESGGDLVAVGDVVDVSACQGSGTLLSSSVNGEFVVESIGTKTAQGVPFFVRMKVNAKSTVTFGGATCTVQKIGARGIQEIWNASLGADKVVRVTEMSSKPYHYAILEIDSSYAICYHSKNTLASYSDIAKLGSDIVCK